MHGTVGSRGGSGLERSCSNQEPISVRLGAGAPGLERAEIRLSEWGYRPHQHDAYGIGITLAGLQAFCYRGQRHLCVPGQLHILHPGETHDGAAVAGHVLMYRIVYLAPGLLRGALGGRPLPFVTDPVQPVGPATRRLAGLLSDIDEPVSDLYRTDIAATVADLLSMLAGQPGHDRAVIDVRAADLAREYLAAHAAEQTPAAVLETITGADRFTLARHFRLAFGTSPDRYRIMRRLDLARAAIEHGTPLAQAAIEAGFADQSHMTRQFGKTYGLTPGRWATALRHGHDPAQPPDASRPCAKPPQPLAAIASQVGYTSEFAFGREFHVSPGRYRRDQPDNPTLLGSPQEPTLAG
jgi:AraC-like DNA-binding protein